MNTFEITENFLTTSQAKDFLSLSVEYIKSQCRKGAFVGAEKISNTWFIPRESAVAYKAAHTRTKKQNAIRRRQKKKEA